MPNPPLCPLILENGCKISYFEKLAEYASLYLKEDGINLNFDGYSQTLKEYEDLQETELQKSWTLIKELNSWAEYFSSMSNLIQKLYLDSETDKIEIQASASIKADATKVANGERLSNLDANVVFARKKRNTLKCFYDELTSKISFLERAHYHCKATCDWAVKSNTAQF